MMPPNSRGYQPPRQTAPAGPIQSDMEQALSNLPDQVADALLKWRMATLEREKTDAKLYLSFKVGGGKRTGDDLKAMVRDDDEHFRTVLEEAKAESNFVRLNERLLAWKKLASMRAAF